MDRREFIKSVGVAGGLMAGGPAVLAAPARSAAAAAEDAGGDAPDDGVASRRAMLELLRTIERVQARHLSPRNGITDPADVAEGERAIAHLLETGLFFWMEGDPERPVFKPYVTPTRKLLGDNPDSVYFFAPIRDDRSYRIRGNVGAATFTSFTVEAGSGEGHLARGSISALADDEMEIARDGSFEILVSREKPARGNWLKLGPGAGQISTRHYHETRECIAANAATRIRLHIEPLDPAPLEPWGGDARIAERLGWVANFVREHAALAMTPTTPEMAKQLGWVSIEPNRFTAPGQWRSSSDDIAYGNTHAWYCSAPYALEPDEALVIESRFPQCRFANVVLWTRFMQSYDYANRQVSFNRAQIDYERDGSFRLVVAHRDPGVPNWLDTEGRPRGQIYWRWVHPVEAPPTPKTRVVKLASLRSGAGGRS